MITLNKVTALFSTFTVTVLNFDIINDLIMEAINVSSSACKESCTDRRNRSGIWSRTEYPDR